MIWVKRLAVLVAGGLFLLALFGVAPVLGLAALKMVALAGLILAVVCLL